MVQIETVSVSDNYAYVADEENGFLIIDISNPSYPILASNYDISHIRNFFISNDYAYLATYEVYDYETSIKMCYSIKVLNISNPVSPSFAGEYYTADMPQDVTVSDDCVYVVLMTMVL